MACTTYVPPTLPNGDGGPLPNPPDNSAQAGAAGAAGEGGGGFSSGRGGDGGFGAGMSASLAGEGGTSPSDSGGATGAEAGPKMTFGCQVQRSPDAQQSVVSQCALAGPGGNNAPCLTSSDCQAGFGCVGDQDTESAVPFVIAAGDAGAQAWTDTYCTERPLRDAVTNAGQLGQRGEPADGSGHCSAGPKTAT